jgi:hypothetical protein
MNNFSVEELEINELPEREAMTSFALLLGGTSSVAISLAAILRIP